jgi:putative transposase
MVNYRRAQEYGGTFFFTLTLHDRRSALLTRYINELRCAFKEVQSKKPFIINAIVILPDHLHCVWTLPPEDADFSGRWRLIKSRFVQRIRKTGAEVKLNLKGEADI